MSDEVRTCMMSAVLALLAMGRLMMPWLSSRLSTAALRKEGDACCYPPTTPSSLALYS